jgi:hypothetical protein
MRYRVEIYDTDGGVLDFDLKDVLSALPPASNQLEWYVLDLEAVGAGPSGEPIIDFEQSLASHRHGAKLSWANLGSLAQNLTQTINATLVGVSAELPPPCLPLPSSYPAEIIVEAIDSSLWAVSSSSIDAVQSIGRRFRKTKVDGPSVVDRPGADAGSP